MKLIDRLLIDAKSMISDRRLVVAMVERIGGKWIATAHFEDKAKGIGVIMESSTHNSIDDAINHLHKLGDKYPNNRDVPIIIDDFEDG